MTDGRDSITIHDIDVPFLRIVVIMIKWSIAAIPAVFIVTAALFGIESPPTQ